MITAIIWSMDRAAQLDLLLRSITRNIPDTFDIRVIYKASSEEYQKGYNWLQAQIMSRQLRGDAFSQPVFLEEEHDGSLALYTRNLVHKSLDNSVCLFTDDTVIYRKSPLIGEALEKRLADRAVFSLRVGFNTIVQNFHTGLLQPPINLYVDEGETISWNFHNHHPLSNYGHPFGLDGHIFETKFLDKTLSEIDFQKPNQLEEGLINFRNKIPQYMRSFNESVAVNIPINSQIGVIPAGKQHPISLEELNQKFLDGYILDLNVVASNPVHGCHQEMPLTFIKETK